MAKQTQPEYDIRVDYDNHPNEVADAFIKALKKYGIEIDDVTADTEAPYMFYKIRISK